MIRIAFRSAVALVLALAVTQPLSAQQAMDAGVPAASDLLVRSGSELADAVNRFAADWQTLRRRYDASGSPEQAPRMRAFFSTWRARLAQLDFDALSQEGRVDYVLLDNLLRHQLALLDREQQQRAEAASLLPFADSLLALQDARRDLRTVDAAAAARTLASARRVADSLRALFEPAPRQQGANGGSAKDAPTRPAAPKVSRTVANRAAQEIDGMRRVLTGWYKFYEGYDPMFTWWARDPWRKLDSSLVRYAKTLRERVVGVPPGAKLDANEGPIVGDPIGAAGLAEDLRFEMIPYTAEELIAIAEREYAFSLSEVKKAAREMGFGDDWKAAMEKVKDTYVEPGKQPELIRDLARQAEAFFDAGGWVTIPPLAKEDWRMEMMSPERQRLAPFFLGGDLILVAYPTDAMSDEDKLMSLRGNNPHFSHATVFHELNPGHHLQGFMLDRYNAHRQLFRTPFWNEGQSLYWEMFVWDTGRFHVSPEDRIGALFWRMHRSARIIFSLKFHLGQMTPDQAIQFLVDTVDFERANAEGEVRRSFGGQYSPLYQAAYMLGGLQLRALHHELVDSGKMTDRQFHDAVLRGGAMPIAMVRARLENLPLTRDGAAPWHFASELPPPRPFTRQ